MEIVFSVTQENDGGYGAECLSHDIFTQGNTWEELRNHVREAVSAYFLTSPNPMAYACIWHGMNSSPENEIATGFKRRRVNQAALEIMGGGRLIRRAAM